ncbi:MAG: helix-turn-helix transcriptional regulator [Marinomonas sp.]
MNETNKVFDRVLSPDEVSQIMGRSKKTLWRLWRKEGKFPRPIQINGRAIGWRESTINAFLTETGEVM